jgi:prepilin-type processing-associated H-X9-DG protein
MAKKCQKYWNCPSDEKPMTTQKTIGLSYAMSAMVGGKEGYSAPRDRHRMSMAKNPSYTCMLVDSGMLNPSGIVKFFLYGAMNDEVLNVGLGSDLRIVSYRHANGANLLHVDGHANWKKAFWTDTLEESEKKKFWEFCEY